MFSLTNIHLSQDDSDDEYELLSTGCEIFQVMSHIICVSKSQGTSIIIQYFQITISVIDI